LPARVCGKGFLPRAGEYTGAVLLAALRGFLNEYAPDLLPKAPAVEVTLGAEPLEEGLAPADYPHEIFRRLIYLPVGTSDRTGGTVIHDGPGGPS
jgi:hypothetical protein